jgi:hypothetical protein
MFSINGKEYVYFLEGKFIIIKQKNTSQTTPILVEPTETISNGVVMDITRVPDFSQITKESHDLPIPEALEESIVTYVQAQLSQDIQEKEYYLQKFNKKVSRFDSTRAGGARIVKGNWLLR